MPELPEVETVRRGLEPALVGSRLLRVEARRADLRVPFPERFAERLTGRRVEALTRRAKYLLAPLDDGETLVMHLGMSGSFRVERDGETLVRPFHDERPKLAAHDHVVFTLDSAARVTYNDPRRFGSMMLTPTALLSEHPAFRNLGVEPLSDEFDAARLAAVLEGARTPLKSALLDQTRIAGLGNIYVCEALHRAGLSPMREAGLVKGRGRAGGAGALARAIREVLEEAVKAGGSTLRDHRRTDGKLGYFQHSFAVYDREGAACPKPRCQGTITRIVQGGRSTFYCPSCQK
ncbi:MAG: bifunctional DNA-formamidopyrimidine glycosylase/DNA-(apurinic or apyrimidinic site) lyase [Hyphomicrobiales bacterium]|nr:bifunctional DNA-formamidopyrimidine glycosylase/DNA-(apurinic or apyrimidinic site) lyase [Hyphomicrobiales bacterium]